MDIQLFFQHVCLCACLLELVLQAALDQADSLGQTSVYTCMATRRTASIPGDPPQPSSVSVFCIIGYKSIHPCLLLVKCLQLIQLQGSTHTYSHPQLCLCVHMCVCAHACTPVCVWLTATHSLLLSYVFISPQQQRLVFVLFPLPPHPLLLWGPSRPSTLLSPLPSRPGLLASGLPVLALQMLFPELFFYLKAATTACIG